MMRVCAPTTVNSIAVLSSRWRSSDACQLKIGQADQRMRDHLRVLQEFAHAYIERRMRQLARIASIPG